ncbi:MAG: helix-turn-helix domain-containing protein, partial [Thermoguttaceae bacterium]
MANLLTMADIQAILGLHEKGWPQRRIARELNVDRETVAKYVRARLCAPKPAKAPLGSEETHDHASHGARAAEGMETPARAEAFQEMPGIEAGASSPHSTYHAANSKPAKAPLGSD